MAAKHDGKKARANFWVAQQNIAKSKGGRPQFQHKAPKPAGASVITVKIASAASAEPSRSEEATPKS